ncbi:hypothetical protein A3A66_03675 [Microgenomates group bacterium RIFCSPLOWO2_01_FULL_46_13]|nr:MAG: hypothetical protein A3A66_03675 [Microgenomates group bacterium RIFCSPLOWO2_01_FULL_46_13]
MEKVQRVEISHRTVVFTVLFLVGLYLVYLIRDIIFLVFLAVLLMTAINPVVTYLTRYKIPRAVGGSVMFLVVFGLLISGIAALIPPLISQSVSLFNQIPIPPSIANDFRNLNINLQDLEVIANQLDTVPKVVDVVASAFSGFIAVVTLLVIAFYLTVERPNLHKYLTWLFGHDGAEERAEQFITNLEQQIGGWVRGELALMVVVGSMTFIGLKLLNVSFALPLAILAGLLEIIPNIGPVVSAIPAILVAYFTVSFPMSLAVTALYVLVQQLENNFIVPMVMKKAVGLNPLVTIILLATGFRLGGVGGAALAIPIFLTVRSSIQEFIKLKGLQIRSTNG